MGNRLLLDPVSGAHLSLEKNFVDVLLLGVPGMAEQLANIQITAEISATLQNVIDNSEVTAEADQGIDFSPATSVSSGTSADQADRAWQDVQRELAAGASENIDLYDLASIDIGAGAGRDALGQTNTYAELVGLIVTVDADSQGSLVIGGEGSAAAFNSIFDGSDSAKLGPFGPGAVQMMFRPDDPAWSISDGSNHLLQFAESTGANSVKYSVAALLRSS